MMNDIVIEELFKDTLNMSYVQCRSFRWRILNCSAGAGANCKMLSQSQHEVAKILFLISSIFMALMDCKLVGGLVHYRCSSVKSRGQISS